MRHLCGSRLLGLLVWGQGRGLRAVAWPYNDVISHEHAKHERGHGISSVSVIANALRLRKVTP